MFGPIVNSMTVAVRPVHALWVAHGHPAPEGPTTPGRCGACHTTGPVVPVETVVSRSFTGWDQVPNGTWCGACAHAHAIPDARTRPVVIHADQTLQTGWEAVRDHLLAGPVTPDMAVVSPVTGRLHLLGSATWGTVSTDAGQYPWTRKDALRLARVCALVKAGVTSTSLARPAPPVGLVSKPGPIPPGEVLHWWDEFIPWRERGTAWWRMVTAAAKG